MGQRRDLIVHLAPQTRGFAAPAFAGCAFVEGEASRS